MTHHKLSEDLCLEHLQSKPGNLATLFKQAKAIVRLEEQMNSLLPERLRGHFKIAGYQHPDLILQTHSASLLTAFRMYEDTIVAQLRQTPRFQHLNKIRIKVRPQKAEQKLHRKMDKISKKNAQLLQSEAEQTKDCALRDILMRLASHTKEENS